MFNLARDPANRLAFQNTGGLLNGGVCWWHSRFLRNALYLSIFRPDLAKPSADHARWIVRELRRGKRVVEIPGYHNLREFSSDWRHEIQRKLEDWQKTEGFLHFAWLKGLAGRPEVSARRLYELMLRISREVNHYRRVAFSRLQIPGITSHAWLITGMKRKKEGFAVEYIDSNYPDETRTYDYKNGDRVIKLYGHLVPYIGETGESKRFERVAQDFCSNDGKQ